MNNTCIALRVDPKYSGYTVHIDRGEDGKCSLAALQQAVGGLIQVIYPFEDNVAIVCNDEGKLLGLPANRALRTDDGEIYDILVGSFLVVGLGGDGDFIDLAPALLEKYKAHFTHPERFYLDADGNVVSKKLPPKKHLPVEIWQLKDSAPAVLRYEAFDAIGRFGLSFQQENYKKVYAFNRDEADTEDVLDETFYTFNCDHPCDFRGHSLSVSDVVVVGKEAFYVDRFGFQKVLWAS